MDQGIDQYKSNQGYALLWTRAALAIVAFIVVVAGAASACTTWKGKLTVTGNGSTPGSVSAMARGQSMQWCSQGQPTGTANVTSNTAGTVGVIVEPSSASCFNNKMDASNYDIRWTTGTWDAVNQTGSDCMDTTDVGDITVGAGGTGSATSGSFNPGAAGMISVCVASKQAPMPLVGNQVPVSVI